MTPFFSEGSTGRMLIKAFSDLGLNFKVVDSQIQEIPKEKFDYTIVWCNNITSDMLPESYKVLLYIDDPKWWEGTDNSLYTMKKGYNKVYTIMKIKNYPSLHLGCDTDIHKKIDLNKELTELYKSDISFIGTLRDDSRAELIVDLIKILPNNMTFKIWGNGWNHPVFRKHWMMTPAYYDRFVSVCNSSKIVFQQHFSGNPNTKDFEVPCCGTCLYMVNDTSIHTKEIYPMMPTYSNASDLLKKSQYYLSHWDEAEKIIAQMQEIAKQYTYTKQLQKLISTLE